MLEVLSFQFQAFSDWKEAVMVCGKPIHHTTAASYIEVLSFPISKHALTLLSWTVWELFHHITPTSYILSPFPSLYRTSTACKKSYMLGIKN